MQSLQQETTRVLQHMATRLRQAVLPRALAGEIERLAAELERLAGQVEAPCVVAVVGQVKAGKSTFINALLGDDLAKVGTTETTATINYFRFGNPDPARPVRCHWRGGRITEENRAFLDSLQGNDTETLRRADGIAYLEYFLPHPRLRQITLVDTPGTNSTVAGHQHRTAEFMHFDDQLRAQLATRHDTDTRRLGSEADAVIYLIGEVARSTEQAFLEAFAQATGRQSRAFNALGVMARIDLGAEIMA